MISSNRICITTFLDSGAQHVGRPLTGAPQIAAIISGFPVGTHALRRGEYWTSAGAPLVRLRADEQRSRDSPNK